MTMPKRPPAQRLRAHLRANFRANLSRLRSSVVEGAQVAENRMALLGAMAVSKTHFCFRRFVAKSNS